MWLHIVSVESRVKGTVEVTTHYKAAVQVNCALKGLEFKEEVILFSILIGGINVLNNKDLIVGNKLKTSQTSRNYFMIVNLRER